MAKKKSNPRQKPKVNKQLDGFEISINSFGEIHTNYDIDKLNAFLNENIDDKKLRGRNDIPGRMNKKRKKQ
ncbi:MAG: hypothetical protein NZ529_08375 [Cytophagaceae bacterium]|nr:hypothetical protein [Cytophagaceae bacterium]MDW8456799.1 hypothetical protein [Cytophagaceae bacterium]